MHFLHKAFLLLIFILVSPIHADQESFQAKNVIILHSMEHISQHIDPNTLTSQDMVIFDLDNTVMWPTEDSTFTDHGFKAWAAHHAQAIGIPQHEAYQHLLPVWIAHQEDETVKPVEVCVVALINSLQKQGVVVIGLTSRSVPVINHTLRMINSIQIDFSKTCPVVQDLCLAHHKYPAKYHQGIFFCGNNGKGALLETLLTSIAHPKRILFFDDLEHHIVNVKKVVEDREIEYYGFRYAHLDEYIKNFKLHHHMIPDLQPKELLLPQASEQTSTTARE